MAGTRPHSPKSACSHTNSLEPIRPCDPLTRRTSRGPGTQGSLRTTRMDTTAQAQAPGPSGWSATRPHQGRSSRTPQPEGETLAAAAARSYLFLLKNLKGKPGPRPAVLIIETQRCRCELISFLVKKRKTGPAVSGPTETQRCRPCWWRRPLRGAALLHERAQRPVDSRPGRSPPSSARPSLGAEEEVEAGLGGDGERDLRAAGFPGVSARARASVQQRSFAVR